MKEETAFLKNTPPRGHVCLPLLSSTGKCSNTGEHPFVLPEPYDETF